MSFRALNWAKLQRVGHQPSKHLLLLLAEYADDVEECFPSQERLAAETEMTVRAVSSCLLRLEALGLVERRRSRRADGTLGVTRYRLRTDRTADPASLRADRAAEKLPLVDVEEPPERRSGGCEPPERHDITTGTSFRSSIRKNLQKRTIERGARARPDATALPDRSEEPRRAQAPDLDKGFDVFMRRYPFSRTDNQQRAEAAWSALSEADRKRALEGIDAYRHEARRAGRTKLFAASTYLGQRVWERYAHEPASAAGKGLSGGVVGAFSRGWWAAFHRKLKRGERVQAMLAQAANGTGYALSAADLPTVEEENALVRMASTSPEFVAWREWLAMKGHALPAIDAPFVWMPTPLPASSPSLAQAG